MANADRPDGFRPVTSPARTNVYECSAAVSTGDMVALVSGKVTPYDASSHTEVIGVAAQDGAGSGALVQVFDDYTTLFEGQTSNSFAVTNIGANSDVSGSTGAMEVDAGAGSNSICRILEHYPLPGSEETGANARVKFIIIAHTALG